MSHIKTYLVTGAAGGLGSELVSQLCQQGHQVIALDKELGKLNHFYDQWETDFPEQVSLYPMDLLGANIDHYQEMSQAIAQNFDSLDGILLNAAIFPAFTPIEHFDYKQWYEVLHTNLNANFHLTQTLLPQLLSSKGHIIAIGDQDTALAPAYLGAYGVAKAGLKQLMHTLANEHCEKCLHVYWAELSHFASEAHLRMFPGKNPESLTDCQHMAQFILDSMHTAKSQSELGSIQQLKATLSN